MNRKFICNSNFVLKNVLQQKENLDIVQDFIEGILKIKIKKIIIAEKIKDNLFEDNLGIINVRIITDSNETINVGIQIIDGNYIQYKMILFYAQLHSSQELYNEIAKTITINIIDEDYFIANKYFKINQIKGLNDEIMKNINKGEMHILQLPKFAVQEINTKEEAWVQYLKNGKVCEKYEKIKKLDNALEKYWKEEII